MMLAEFFRLVQFQSRFEFWYRKIQNYYVTIDVSTLNQERAFEETQHWIKVNNLLFTLIHYIIGLKNL